MPYTSREWKTGLLVGLLVILVIGGSRLFRLMNSNAIRSQEPVSIFLEEPAELEEVSIMLADSGVVKDRESVIWAGRLLGWNRFSKGHYRVEGGSSYEEFLSRMARGIQDPVTVTIPPGLTIDQIVTRLSGPLQADSVDIRRALEDETLLSRYDIPEQQLIGRLLPDTYSIYWTTPAEKVVERILNEFDRRVVEPNRERLEEIDRTLDEIVTMASIVEMESAGEEEKPTISGLYWNRLEQGMRLQADPTISYAIGERRRLLYEDYQLDHPYNTYRNDGLPPGPITNPSVASIRATLYPENHDYLYMVASPQGTHIFTETFEEHKRESAKWREWLREQYRIRDEQQNGDTNS